MTTLPHAGETFPVGVGFSTILPELDFETYSEAGYVWDEESQQWGGLPGAGKKRGLTVVGTYNYVMHPSFEIIQLAYNLKDGHGAQIWRPGMPPPTSLFTWIRAYRAEQPADWSLGLLESWNNFFEVVVWTLHCVSKLGWPPLYLDQMRDAMAQAALAGYPRALANAGPVLKLVFQKDPAGTALIKKLTVPKNPTKKNPDRRWTRATAPADFAKFDAYNVTDILSESEASSKLPDLPPRELEIWQVDQRINHRGFQLDVYAIDNGIAIIEQAISKYNAELSAITNGAVKSYTEVKPTLAWLKKQGVYLDGLDEDVVTEQLLRAHQPAVLRVLRIRQTLSFGSVQKLYTMRLQVCADGRLRDSFSFASAHTHLWNGQGPQVMNLFKGKFTKPEQVELALSILATRDLTFVEKAFEHGPPWDPNDNDPMDALEVIAHCMRSMIIARPGTRFISADYNAIQAVVTAALAGEKWQLDVFHTHGKIYETTAAGLTGKTLEFYLEYRKQHGKHHEDRQTWGKIPTLASGFGAWVGGWRRFDDDGILPENDDDLKEIILRTRAKIPNTVELWGGQTRNKFNKAPDGSRAPERQEYYGLEGAAIQAIRNPGTTFGYRGIRYAMHGDALYCKPPGGDDYSYLVYHEPRLQPSSRKYASPWELEMSYMGWNSNQTKGKGGWVRMPLYGGVQTQNVVAKVSREFQADALVALDKTAIYLPVHHAHDENVTEVENGRGNVPEYLEIVNRQKPWAVDDWGRPWPVKAPAAEETQRYGKWE